MASTDDTPGHQAPFGRWGTRVYDGLGRLGGAILGLMTLAVFVQVVMRFLGRAMDGLDEVPRYLFVWLVMIGAAAAMHRGEHTMLEYFRDRLRPRTRALTSVITHGAGMLLFASLIKSSLVLVPNAHLQTSAGLNLPLGYVYAAVPVGSALILLPMAWRFIASLRALWQRPS
ncbi:MAG: TRAP transporter small permease [Candidatus Rokuibacteriota bacterium]|nr:MAG: TRAP transporter small permease [Candidatus Rokubacteria bacterium]